MFAAGYWYSTIVTIPASKIDATGISFVQIRAWAIAAGPTFEAALATGSSFASSSVWTVTPTTAPDLPAIIARQTSFSFNVPEPSIMALGALGGLALLTSMQVARQKRTEQNLKSGF